MSEGQKHLLIVDDENALREAIAERLADHGFVVEQAASGEQAPAADSHRQASSVDFAIARARPEMSTAWRRRSPIAAATSAAMAMVVDLRESPLAQPIRD